MTYCTRLCGGGIVATGVSEPKFSPQTQRSSGRILIHLEMIVSRLLHCRLPVKGQIGIRALSISSSLNNARWLSETKSRLGKLFFHGTTTEEAKEASDILKDLAKNWREYVATSEGFLTGEKWRGLYRHNVVWGDMVSTTNSPFQKPKTCTD